MSDDKERSHHLRQRNEKAALMFPVPSPDNSEVNPTSSFLPLDQSRQIPLFGRLYLRTVSVTAAEWVLTDIPIYPAGWVKQTCIHGLSIMWSLKQWMACKDDLPYQVKKPRYQTIFAGSTNCVQNCSNICMVDFFLGVETGNFSNHFPHFIIFTFIIRKMILTTKTLASSFYRPNVWIEASSPTRSLWILLCSSISRWASCNTETHPSLLFLQPWDSKRWHL